MTADEMFFEGLKVAKTFDVFTPVDSLVLYSITGQPTKANRDLAFAYASEHPGMMMLDHTPCGAKLVEMGFMSNGTGIAEENVMLVWKEASKRLIEQASGNVTAFVDNATEESVFCSMELPIMLGNENIATINGTDKFAFAKKFAA